MLGAFYLAFSTPMALALAPAVQPITQTPGYLKPIITHPSPLSSDLSEVSPVPVYIPPPAPVPVYTAPTAVVGCGSDPNLAYIYQHESGCNTASINSIGCAGLGQACPGSKLPCSLSDWDCQNAYFTAYAISTYGSTYNAMLAWQSKSWW